MRRKKSRAKRQITRSTEEDVADVDNVTGPSKNETEAPEAGNESVKDVNAEFDCFKEEFEEVDNVISAVMGMDSIIQRNGDGVVEDESNLADGSIDNTSKLDLEVNALNCVGGSQKSDNMGVSLECSTFEAIIEDENVRGQILSSKIDVTDMGFVNEVDYIELPNGLKYAEQKSIEEEPSATRVTVMTLDGYINDGNIKGCNDGEKEKDSRDEQEQKEKIEVSDINKVAQVFNHDSLQRPKLEEQLEIHVGGLLKEIVEQDLFEIFGKFGEVKSAKIVRNRNTKKSEGFAFIQYATAEQAKKVVSDLKDGIEVKGKLAKLSISHDCDVLYVGHICKTWTKEDVLAKLKGYGIENINQIHVPIDSKNDKKIKGFAFLRFNTFSDAMAAFQRLRKERVVFGNKTEAKIAFAHNPMHSREEVRLQVKTIYVEGIPKSWDVHRLKEICEQYAETKKVQISRNLGNKGKDFGFISFFTRGDAVASMEGINKLRYGGDVKVKAYIARPLVQMWLQKSSCVRLKFNRRHRNTDRWKMKGHTRSKGAEREKDVKAPTVINKSKVRGTKEKPSAVVYNNNLDPLNSKHTAENKTNEQKSIASEVRNADIGLSTNPRRTRSNRRSQRRQKRRMTEKTEGASQGRSSRSSRRTKSKPHKRMERSRGADSIGYRVPFKEAYAASTSGYRGSAYGPISGSKRLSSYMEPSAGFMQPVTHNDQYHAERVTHAFQHQRQPYAGYLKADTHYERQPPAKYFKPAIGNDTLPQAGFLESSFRNPVRRIVEYSGPDNQGAIYGEGSITNLGSAYSHPYVPNNMSYARYEGGSSGSGYHRYIGAYPPRQTRY